MIARPARLRAAALAALLVALVALAPGGCGPPDAPTSAGEPWPLTFDGPGLLAYVALSLPADVQAGLLSGITSCEPRGLRAGGPLLVVQLDEKTHGGPLAILLPVADRDELQASLHACPAMQPQGDDRWRFVVPADSPLRMLPVLMSGLHGGSPFAMMAALTDAPQPAFGFDQADEGDYVIFAPSFEAVSACRSLLRAAGGFAEAPAHALVASLDLARQRVVFAESIEAAEKQLRALMSGASTAGAFGAVMAAGRGERGGGPSLPVNWELLWALKDMASFSSVEALQFSADAAPAFWDALATAQASFPDDSDWDGSDRDDSDRDERSGDDRDGSERDGDARDRDRDEWGERDADPLDDDDIVALGDAMSGIWQESFFSLPQLRLRLRLAADSALTAVLASAVPAPEIDDALLVLAADPQRFAPAFAQWCRPIAEVVKGRGPPAERYLDELASLLTAWGGQLAVLRTSEDTPVLIAALAPGRGEADIEAWRRWLGPLLTTARIKGLGGALPSEARADGVRLLRSESGDVALSFGWTDDAAWVAPGEVSAPPASALQAFRFARDTRTDSTAANSASMLRVSVQDGAADVAVDGAELQVTWRPGARER